MNSQNQLVLDNLKFAEAVARRLWEKNRALQFAGTVEDAIQAGVIGLISAAKRYDAGHESGAKFRSYAALRIRGEIIDAMRENGFLVKQPRNKPHLPRTYTTCETQFTPLDEDVQSIRLSDVPARATDEAAVENVDLVRFILQGMSDRSRAMVIWYYGLFGEQRCTMKEIAKRLGISESRVSQMWESIEDYLRTKTASRRMAS